jgi:G3E family GTPase
MPRVPITVVTGPLGSGKTTLLRHILEKVTGKTAILMNEFGEIAIDSRIIQGKNVRIAELANGCVCCSLQGEFEAAVNEVLDAVSPEIIIVEATGVAEPDALILDIEDNLPRVRLDGVITIADADSMLRFPRMGHTMQMQIEAADIILLNKIDLVPLEAVGRVRDELRRMNGKAAVIPVERCAVATDVLFGIYSKRDVRPPAHLRQAEFESFSYETEAVLERAPFEDFAASLGEGVCRAKGFVRFPEGTHLFNFVSGRWELEPFPEDKTVLVFIGRGIRSRSETILLPLKKCERRPV